MALFARQKAILELVDLAGGGIDRLRLVKLAFLARQEHLAEEPSFYGFVPYQYGPFSFTLYHDAEKLIEKGYLTGTKSHFQLRDDAPSRPAMPEPIAEAVAAVWRRYGAWPTAKIIKHVYAAYPWYTANTKDTAKRAAVRPDAEIAVYTAGYEGLTQDEFLDRLLRQGITQLLDVRKNPVARRYGFHRSSLSRSCEHLGITYRHVPDLGIPGELRTDLTDQASRDRLFKRYRAETLSANDALIERVRCWVEAEPTVLVCLEANPCECHRAHLGEELVKRTGLPMIDIGASCAAA